MKLRYELGLLMPVIISWSVTTQLWLMQALKCEQSDESGRFVRLNLTVVIIIWLGEVWDSGHRRMTVSLWGMKLCCWLRNTHTRTHTRMAWQDWAKCCKTVKAVQTWFIFYVKFMFSGATLGGNNYWGEAEKESNWRRRVVQTCKSKAPLQSQWFQSIIIQWEQIRWFVHREFVLMP